MKTELELTEKPIPPISKIRYDEIENESELSLLKSFFSSNFDRFLVVFSIILTILIFVLAIKQLLVSQ